MRASMRLVNNRARKGGQLNTLVAPLASKGDNQDLVTAVFSAIYRSVCPAWHMCAFLLMYILCSDITTVSSRFASITLMPMFLLLTSSWVQPFDVSSFLNYLLFCCLFFHTLSLLPENHISQLYFLILISLFIVSELYGEELHIPMHCRLILWYFQVFALHCMTQLLAHSSTRSMVFSW